MASAFTGVKVFSATKAREREAIFDDRVEGGVDALDLSDVRLDDLARARALLTDHRGELDG